MEIGTLTDESAESLDRSARPVTGVVEDDGSLLHVVGDRRFLLIGEASHGTHEVSRKLVSLGASSTRWASWWWRYRRAEVE